MALTSHDTLQEWLIRCLGDAGGSAPRLRALAMIEAEFSAHFTPDDLQSPGSRPFETRWRHQVSWQRLNMVKAGLLQSSDTRGTWSLTTAGWREYDELAMIAAALDDPFASFRPKDSSDYVAQVKAATFVKRRSHEALIADFGLRCVELGLRPDTAVHPRDLVIRGSGVEWLVEAKVVYRGNATHAVRAALAQALEYRFFLHGEPRPRPLALFDQPVGDAYIEFLEAHGVALVWQHDGGWAASPSARRFAS